MDTKYDTPRPPAPERRKPALAKRRCGAHLKHMPRPDPLPPPKARPSPLDNPAVAAHAWARFRRLMRLMFLVTTGTVLIALALLYKQVGLVSVHFYI
ncbi:MAG TPA: hypothetical protein VFF94_10705, partial [Novosphingobium sp.]|nr:hypothetical protein [Novosphingobium sp.]